jgi:hypothetical protein
MSTSPGPFGAADRTFIRVYLLLSVAKKLCLPFAVCKTASTSSARTLPLKSANGECRETH